MNKEKSKARTCQATILGRVERLVGNGLISNPFPHGSEEWYAFNEGWSRPFDNPIANILQKNKKTLQRS
jgi:hypothetical protein